MRRVLRLASVALFLLVTAGARADTVFNLNGTLQDGVGQFNGTIRVTTFQGYHVAGTVTDGSYSFTVPTVYFGETIDEGAVTLVDVFSLNLNYDVYLYFPKGLLLNGMGGSFCSLSTPCPGAGTSYFREGDPSGNPIFAKQYFQTLVATPQVTPEPGSLLLLGTGMLALAAGVRKRFLSVA